MIPLYNRVRVVSDRFADAGVTPGMIGYVIERYDDGSLEIEVSNPENGITLAQFVAQESDLELAEEPH